MQIENQDFQSRFIDLTFFRGFRNKQNIFSLYEYEWGGVYIFEHKIVFVNMVQTNTT